MTRRLLAVLALSLLPLLGACSSSDHDDADVTFVQQMLPHHEQAVQMSDMALARPVDPQVRMLASEIRDAQSPEIAQMTGFLAQWGVPRDAGMPMGMPGMADMGALSAASGPAFDRLWVQDMIAHHRGAITMADQELATGTSDDALALATSIRTTQQREIDTMTALLGRLG